MRALRQIWAAAIVCLLAQSRAAEVCESQRPAAAAAEEQAVASCLSLIRNCQLPDGAFAQVSPGDNPHAPVWIAPYFANVAALALLAGHAHTPNPADLARVRRWLDWCAKHQSAEGYWNDFEGAAGSVTNNGRIDAWDSSAALFLQVAGRCRRAGGQPTEAVSAAVARALACIEKVTDADGLTWAAPAYKIKFLMDNVEVRSGLRATATPTANVRADRIAERLSSFWKPAKHQFAYALHADGTFEGGLDRPYPHGLAQLYGIAWVEACPAAWDAVSHAFGPEAGAAAACGAERWLMASVRAGDKDSRMWRERVAAEVATFSAQRTYLHRPALAALALLEGADWMK